MSVGFKLLTKLQNKRYRMAYLAEHIRTGIAYQVRTLRDESNWTEERLALEVGKSVSFVSKLEDPSYGKFTIQTLLDIASAFDVALIIKFVPFSRFLEEYEDVSPDALSANSFKDDLDFQRLELEREAIPSENIPTAVKRMIAASDRRQQPSVGPNLAPMRTQRIGQFPSTSVQRAGSFASGDY